MIQTKFSASRIGELLTKGQGKTTQSYLLDLSLGNFGIVTKRETAEMRHGLVNEFPAYQLLVQPFYESSKWFNESIAINDKCGASPDFFMGEFSGDVKSPYSIDGFLEQVNSVPKKYFLQVQMQMMATKADKGYLLFYLTKPEKFGEDWVEYPFPIEKRYKLFEYAKDELVHDEILEAVEVNQPKKEQLIKFLESADLMESVEYYERQMYGGYVFRPLKECANIFNLDKCIRVGDNFYYEKR